MSKVVDSISFFVNGVKHTLKSPSPHTTLAKFLRNLGLTGTKIVCSEGGCGACTVMVSHFDSKEKKIVNRAINACLYPVNMMDGMSVVTVEGVGSVKKGMNAVQYEMIKNHASQCGYCTPGFVMSLTTFLENSKNGKIDEHKMLESMDGNLCRCTGYISIIDAAKSLAKNPELKELPIPEEELKNIQPQELEFTSTDGITWFQPTTLESLLKIKERHPNAKIVCGNSEIGIEIKPKIFEKDWVYPIMVNTNLVKELQDITIESNGILLGVGTTLNDLGNFLKRHLNEIPEYRKRGIISILNQLKYFSGTQIRNVATIAGNIATASPISDLNPLWAAMDAYVLVMNPKKETRKIFLKNLFLNYRKIDLKDDEILFKLFIPYTKQNEFIYSFKQSKRREDDIAIVNAGMRIEFNPEKEISEDSEIINASICYGGLWRTIKGAEKLQKYMIGQKFSNLDLRQCLKLLLEEFELPENVPGGMPEYRTALALSFFKKFYIYVKSQISKKGIDQSELSSFEFPEHPIPRSTISYKKIKTGISVGEPIPHVNSAIQVTGESKYVDDLPKLENEKFAAPVLTSIPCGRIKKIDATKALKFPGVRHFITHKDITGENSIGAIVHDEEVFVSENVTSVGQFIGLIIADTADQAKIAAKLVEVEYEEYPAILTIEEAIKQQSFIGEYHELVKGDVDKAFLECDIVVSGEFRMGGQEHFYFEPQSALAIPRETEMHVYSSTQHMAEVQKLVARVLGVDQNRVVTRVKRLGGGFGGKESKSSMVACAAAIAANSLNIPVRLVVDRDVDFQYSGQRHPFLCKYKIGFTKNGKILAWDTQLYSNAGYSLDLSQSVMDRALFHIDGVYNIPNIRTSGRCCKTNLPSNTAFRGFGGPQGLMFAEMMIDRVASELNISPNIVREINMYKKDDITHFGQVLDQGDTIGRLWKTTLEKSDYENRVKSIKEFNKSNKYKKRGISVIPTKFGISFTAAFLNQGGALVQIYTDGTVLISHGGIEMGQGLHTKVQAIASTVLEIPIDKIFISESATDKIPNSSATAASVGSDLYGAAVFDACTKLKERLLPYKEKCSGDFKKMVQAAYLDRVNLAAIGFYKTPGIGFEWDPETGRGSGKPFSYFTHGCACSEVEIDTLTGDFKIIRTDIVMDVGDSLNPAIDIGQIEGAFIQGMGLFTMEELIFGDDPKKDTWIKRGHLKTKGPGNYKIPSMGDVPNDFRLHLLDNVPNKYAILRSKAIGEPPLFLGSSVFYAIKDAIKSYREQEGSSGWFLMDSPATCERIRMKCEDEIVKLVTKK